MAIRYELNLPNNYFLNIENEQQLQEEATNVLLSLIKEKHKQQKQQTIGRYYHNSSTKISICMNCGTRNSPAWRNGGFLSNGKKRILCNACGLRWRREVGLTTK